MPWNEHSAITSDFLSRRLFASPAWEPLDKGLSKGFFLPRLNPAEFFPQGFFSPFRPFYDPQ